MGIGFPEYPAFPASDTNGFSKTPGSLAEFNDNLRLCLDNLGIEKSDEFSSHSAKATLLSMASGFGLSKPTREALGYHVGRSSKDPVDIYARGRLEGPVNELALALASMRHTESQKIANDVEDNKEDDDIAQLAVADASDDEPSVDEAGPVNSESSEEEVDENAIAYARPVHDPKRLLYNRISRKLHMGRMGSVDLAICGNTSPHFIQVPLDARGTKCKICFK